MCLLNLASVFTCSTIKRCSPTLSPLYKSFKQSGESKKKLKQLVETTLKVSAWVANFHPAC